MKIVFICTHNACRSILSEAITRDLAKGRVQVGSAGSNPSGRVHPLTFKYLQAHGYGTDGLTSKGMDAIEPFAPTVVVTVCDSAAQEACPVWLGDAIKVHWGLPDPSQGATDDASSDQAFAGVIATIEQRVQILLSLPFETMDKAQLGDTLRAIGGQA